MHEGIWGIWLERLACCSGQMADCRFPCLVPCAYLTPSVLRYHTTGRCVSVINSQITARWKKNLAAAARGNVRVKVGCIIFHAAVARLQKMSAVLVWLCSLDNTRRWLGFFRLHHSLLLPVCCIIQKQIRKECKNTGITDVCCFNSQKVM